MLRDGEWVARDGQRPMLAWHRPGDTGRPLLLFAPGGGHLARIYYGHGGSHERDFLCTWLNELGFELLALSYASDHPAIPGGDPAMRLRDWADDMVCIAAPFARGRELVLVSWSMGGRVGKLFADAARRHGLRATTFVGLAATAPILGLMDPTPVQPRPMASGYWDPSDRAPHWFRALGLQRQRDGREPISWSDYQDHYLARMPVRLQGVVLPEDLAHPMSAAALADELTPYAFAGYPLSGSVIPLDRIDPRHALTNRATWGFVNAQMVYARLEAALGGRFDRVEEETWSELRRRVNTLPTLLTRDRAGGHFFFVGEEGARATAYDIAAILASAQAFQAWTEQALGLKWN